MKNKIDALNAEGEHIQVLLVAHYEKIETFIEEVKNKTPEELAEIIRNLNGSPYTQVELKRLYRLKTELKP